MGAASLGEGEGPILMSEVSCYSNETRLVDCPHSNLTYLCEHRDDVGVVCFGKCVCTCVYCVHVCMHACMCVCVFVCVFVCVYVCVCGEQSRCGVGMCVCMCVHVHMAECVDMLFSFVRK